MDESKARLDLLTDPMATVEARLQAIETISDQLQSSGESDKELIALSFNKFIEYIETTKPQFISETPEQRLRKMILTSIHKLRTTEVVRENVGKIFKLMSKLILTDNEDNVAVVLRLIAELYQTHKPEFMSEISDFIETIKNLYRDIGEVFDLSTMFESRRPSIKELNDDSIDQLLLRTNIVKTIDLDIPTPQPPPRELTSSDESTVQQSKAPQQPNQHSQIYCSSSKPQVIIPRASRSIRTVAELPIIVVYMHHAHKPELKSHLEQLLPLVIRMAALKPPDAVRQGIKDGDVRYDREIYTEFTNARVKCLSFIALFAGQYSSMIVPHHQQITQGLLSILHDCPHELVSMRRQLIQAARHIFGTELRDRFIDHLTELCNDDVLIGSGWAVNETLRQQAYLALLDLLNNYKGRIKHNDIIAAMNLFAKNLHDNTLPPAVQLLAYKAFNNLILFIVAPLTDDNIEPRDVNQARELLLRIIEIFVLKFKNIATFHLQHIKRRFRAQQQAMQQQSTSDCGNQTQPVVQRPVSRDYSGAIEARAGDERLKSDLSSSSTLQVYSINEYKNILTALILGIKKAIDVIPPFRPNDPNSQILVSQGSKSFHSKETIILARLLKYGLRSFDIFTLIGPNMPMSNLNPINRQMMSQQSQGMEEKELLESLASVFTTLHPFILQEIFTKMIGFIVERVKENSALSAIVEYIISHNSVSPIIATILSEFLIARMDEIGSNNDLSNLYLQMFKMVFASVTLYPVENEQMLKPLLHSIVSRSMELASSAKEPYNYFLLLRALFRSIGGGTHDQLYLEFLPLLPNLLQSLNSFQSGPHKQDMKDILTELCLTVPVRLSSLVPFMPTIIYPLVSALDGPPPLVVQGLRTLELCVDNISTDWLYELLQPVRSELMRGLWKTVRHQNEGIAQSCFKVLGKLGGYNRRMLLEPQRLSYIEQKDNSTSHGASIMIHFPDQKVNINLPFDKAVHIACEIIRASPSSISNSTYYKANSWELVKGFLLANISNDNEHTQNIKNFFSNPNLATTHIPQRKESIYKCSDHVSRAVYEKALVGMMTAASVRDIRKSVLPFMNAMVRHHVMLSLGQHLNTQNPDQTSQGMDPFSLVDALAVVIGHNDKEQCKPGYYVMALIIETATMLLGSKERAYELPLINHLVNRMYELCYARAWFTKAGGCISIRFFTDNMPTSKLFIYLKKFVKALLYVMSDLTGDLSNGVVDTAQSNLEHLLNVAAKPSNINLHQAQSMCLNEVTATLIKEITSQNLSVRTHAMKSIELIAQLSDKSPAQIIEPNIDILKTTLPFLFLSHADDKQAQSGPKIISGLEKQPVRTQIGIIHGFTFCVNLRPPVLIVDTERVNHRAFLDQLIRICESDDETLRRLQCYTNVTNLGPVRRAALHALSSLSEVKDYQSLIFKIIFKSTELTSSELQEAAFECFEKFMNTVTIEQSVVQTETGPFFARLKDSKLWDLQSVKRVLCLARLIPGIFDETYCVELQGHLQAISQSAIDDLRTPLNVMESEQVYQRTRRANSKIKISAGILEILATIPPLTKNISMIISHIFKVETAAMLETNSLLREPLKALLRWHPEATMQLLTQERNLNEQQVYRLLKCLLKGPSGKVFRDVLNSPHYYGKLVVLTSGVCTISTTDSQNQKRTVTMDLRYQAILLIYMMIKYDHDWLLSRRQLVEKLQHIWSLEDFHNKQSKVESSDYNHWKTPKLLVQCLLSYFKGQTASGNKEVIEILFQLLRVFTNRYLCDLEFFRMFLEKTVIETYSIEWKREAFAKFVIILHDPKYPQQLKIKIMQHIIIPSFAHSFGKGLGEALLGGPPQLNEDDPNNLIHMFLNKVVDPYIEQMSKNDSRLQISDGLCILILQFSSLLVDQAPQHIHDLSNHEQGPRLDKLVALAQGCTSLKGNLNPIAYYGQSLMSHIIAKFTILKREMIPDLLNYLLKNTNPEARIAVERTWDVLLSAIATRLKDGHAMLLRLTWKMIIDERHNTDSLIHILKLLVRHYRMYYPMRNELIPLMLKTVQRLGFNRDPGLANRRTAVDLCETIMKWEVIRQKDVRAVEVVQEATETKVDPSLPGPAKAPVDDKKPDIERPLDPKYVDALLNLLLRLACSTPGCDLSTPLAHTTIRNLSDRCTTLIKKILNPQAWNGSPIIPPTGPSLIFSNWMSKLLLQVQNQNANIGDIVVALELLIYMCSTVKHESMLQGLRQLTPGVIACARSPIPRVIRSVAKLVQQVMQIFPIKQQQQQQQDANVQANVQANIQANVQVNVQANEQSNSAPNTIGSPSTLAVSVPTQPVTNNAPHPDLEPLYANIQSLILRGLTSYEQAHLMTGEVTPEVSQEVQAALFSSLLLIKAACVNNPDYVDKFMPTLIRVLTKMAKEHTNNQIETTQKSIELLILGLDLPKDRLSTMTVEIRKQFIQQILASLIESPHSDIKILRKVVYIVEEWIKQRGRDGASSSSGPTPREKALLLIKLMLYIERRFPQDPELNSQFLELILYVYRDDELKGSDLAMKLESAFMSGLRCVQPQIRAKFFLTYDQSVKPKLYERLMYIVCAQNWQQIGCHFWIQQCIELILAVATPDLPISTADRSKCLPCIPTTADLGSYNPSDYETSSLMSMLSNDANTVVPPQEDVEFVCSHDDLDNLIGFLKYPKTLEEATQRKNLQIMVNRQANFLEDLKKTRTGDLLRSLTQLCHMKVDLAKETWINMFPRIWRSLNDQQMTLLGREIIPFLCSGAHSFQRECNPSALGTFLEGVARCQPPIQLRPVLMKYLGKNHNVWHRSALMLEDCLRDKSLDTVYPIPVRSNKANLNDQKSFDIITLNQNYTLTEETEESYSDILEHLHEDDLVCGIKQRSAKYEETKKAVMCEQQGFFDQAQELYEECMQKQTDEYNSSGVFRPGMKSEQRFWDKRWIRCAKELNQWDSLLEYGTTKPCTNPMLVLESAWRVPDWQKMREAIFQVEKNCPSSSMWRLQMYKGYNAICNWNEMSDIRTMKESVHVATSYCIQSWKKLPHIITNAHTPLLQASQQLLELNESMQLHMVLTGMARPRGFELWTILKSWPKRLPLTLDDLSHWSDIMTWRQHQYRAIVAHFENQANQVTISQGILAEGSPAAVASQGAHLSAQGLISFGTVARKQGLFEVSLDSLNRLHTMPTVPIYDCFQKIRQQVKCHLQMPTSPTMNELLDSLEIIECTNMRYFQKELISEFYTYKGILNSRLGRYDEANKAFSCAAQMNDSSPKSWSKWGEFLEMTFTRDFTSSSDGVTIDPIAFPIRQMDVGVSAITCLLQACKFYPEPKARKYIAKILWLLSFDSPQNELLDMISNYISYAQKHGLPPTNWIAWIPQILQCLLTNPEVDVMKNLLLLIGRTSPQTVYFPVRTLLHTLKLIVANQPSQQQQHPSPMASTNIASPATTTSATLPHGSPISSTTMTNSSQNPSPRIFTTQASTSTSTATPSVNPNTPTTSNLNLPASVEPSTPGSSTSLYNIGPATPGAPLSPAQVSTPGPASTPVLIQHLQQPVKTIPSPCGSVKIPQSPNPCMQMKHPQSMQAGQHMMNSNHKTRLITIQRCIEITRELYRIHPTTIISLDGITDQMAWLTDYSYEEIQKQFHQALKRCYQSAFESREKISEQVATAQIIGLVRKIVQAFGGSMVKNSQGACGFHPPTVEFLSQRNLAASQDPEFRQTRVKVSADFEDSVLQNMKLLTLISKLKSWINILGQKKKLMPSTYLMEDKCRFLSNFSQHTADVEIPGDALMPKSTQYYVRIARFIPEVKVVEKHNSSARRILIRGHNGKIYPYLVLNDTCLSDTRREERVLQLLRLLNQYLVNKKETGRRYLQFTAPRVVAINPGLRLVEDNTSSLSLIDILKRRISKNHPTTSDMDQDTPIREYYDRLIKLQGVNVPITNKNLREIFLDIQNKIVTKTLLKDWAAQTYIDATDYWVFRSRFTYQLAMACISEYAFLLTRFSPDSMYVHQDTGSISVSFYKFDQGEIHKIEGAGKRVPFRLTPNLSELITPIGIDGPFRGALVAVSRCLTTHDSRVVSIFKAILRDEMMFWQKKGSERTDNPNIIEMVNRVVKKIYHRLDGIGTTNERFFDSQAPGAAQLISRATNLDELCQSDPAWHPWL